MVCYNILIIHFVNCQLDIIYSSLCIGKECSCEVSNWSCQTGNKLTIFPSSCVLEQFIPSRQSNCYRNCNCLDCANGSTWFLILDCQSQIIVTWLSLSINITIYGNLHPTDIASIWYYFTIICWSIYKFISRFTILISIECYISRSQVICQEINLIFNIFNSNLS